MMSPISIGMMMMMTLFSVSMEWFVIISIRHNRMITSLNLKMMSVICMMSNCLWMLETPQEIFYKRSNYLQLWRSASLLMKLNVNILNILHENLKEACEIKRAWISDLHCMKILRKHVKLKEHGLVIYIKKNCMAEFENNILFRFHVIGMCLSTTVCKWMSSFPTTWHGLDKCCEWLCVH